MVPFPEPGGPKRIILIGRRKKEEFKIVLDKLHSSKSAKEIFTALWQQKNFFPKNAGKRLEMIKLWIDYSYHFLKKIFFALFF